MQFSKECAALQRSVSSIMPDSSEVLKNVIEKLTKVVVEVELRYRVVVKLLTVQCEQYCPEGCTEESRPICGG